MAIAMIAFGLRLALFNDYTHQRAILFCIVDNFNNPFINVSTVSRYTFRY